MKEVILNAENFEREVLKAEGKVLVDFFAVWCGPCKMLAPVLERYAESQDEVKVCKLDVDELTPIAVQFGVNVIPTLIVFKDGKDIAKTVGYMDEVDLKKFVEEA